MKTGWELSEEIIDRMIRRLDELQPSLVLECGSGDSTLHLARWCASNGARLVSLEHLERFLEQTVELVAGLPVDLRHAPLRDGFYDTDIPDGIDFVLVDGPPGWGVGRAMVLPRLWSHLSQGFELWLDDANREHETSCLASWQSSYPIDVRLDSRGKGLAVVTREFEAN